MENETFPDTAGFNARGGMGVGRCSRPPAWNIWQGECAMRWRTRCGLAAAVAAGILLVAPPPSHAEGRRGHERGERLHHAYGHEARERGRFAYRHEARERVRHRHRHEARERAHHGHWHDWSYGHRRYWGGPHFAIGVGLLGFRSGFWWHGPRYTWGYARAPFPYFYSHYPPPVVVVQPPPQVYVERPDSPQDYWYYCPSAGDYYPTVPSCPEPWVMVPPREE